MPKALKQDVKIIVEYKNSTEIENVKNLQDIMQKLFNSYIMKSIQNIRKGK